MQFQTSRRRFLLAGVAASAGTMAVGYRWLRDDASAPAGTIEVAQAPTPTRAPWPLVTPAASPTPAVDLDIEQQLARATDDDRARSWQRMQERQRAAASVEPPANMADANAIDIAPELGWRP